MSIESRIESMAQSLRSKTPLPITIELWNGRRLPLAERTSVTLRVPRVRSLRYLLHPDLGRLGEAYVEGHIDVEGRIDEVLSAAEGLARHAGGNARGRLPVFRNFHTRRRDAEAIQYHYDVSNSFYRLWLDREMVYSCAYFESGNEDIDTAQVQKLDHICRKLRLAPGERFLDIGCGWGALVRHAVKHYGVTATGITLSKNQFALANERIREAGLGDRCRVLLQDYRDVPGEGVFDKIASVGMFEHVGLKNLPAYFNRIRTLLREGGIALNHGITSTDPDSRWVGLGVGAFVHKYVFPDGELPHVSLLEKEMAKAGLEVTDVETLRHHYARTLRLWSERLEANLGEARVLAGDKRVRIWRTYLAGCAHGFAQRWMSIHQILAVKTDDASVNPLPWSRRFMYP